MTYSLTIGGIDASAYLRLGSVRLNDSGASSRLLSFELLDKMGVYRPQLGAEIVYQVDGETRFGGSVDDMDEWEDIGTPDIAYSVRCCDHNKLTDRHQSVAKRWTGQTTRAIVLDIVADHLAADGVTTNHVINPGPTIADMECDYSSVRDAFDDLAQRSNCVWFIDYDKDLHFGPVGTDPAPLVIGPTNNLFRNLKVKRTRAKYRNRQFLRGGFDLGDSRTETFAGDGERKSFSLNYPIGAEPTVTVNGVAATVGIRGLDAGYDWYWNKGRNEITQDDGATCLNATQTLSVTYRGLLEATYRVDNDAEIARRKAVEGGSGIYEDVITDGSVDARAMGTEICNANLLYGSDLKKLSRLSAQTLYPGLMTGQTISVQSSKPNVCGEYVITSVTAKDILPSGSTDVRKLEYSIEAIGGTYIAPWFKDLAGGLSGGKAKKKITRPTEQLITNKFYTHECVCREILSFATTQQVFPCLRSAYVDEANPALPHGTQAALYLGRIAEWGIGWDAHNESNGFASGSWTPITRTSGTLEAIVNFRKAAANDGAMFLRFKGMTDPLPSFIGISLDNNGGTYRIRADVSTYDTPFGVTGGVLYGDTTAITFGTAHRVTVTWTYNAGADETTFELFVDGVSQGTLVQDGDPANHGTGDDELTVETDSYHDVYVADVRYWSDVRTPTEIGNLKFDRLVGNEAGLELYWRLDEGSGVIIKDSTANARDGTLTAESGEYPGWCPTEIEWHTAYANGQRLRAFLDFGNLSALWGTRVISATLRIYAHRLPLGAVPFTIKLVEAAADETTVDWGNQPSVVTTLLNQAVSSDPSGTWIEVDLTAIAQTIAYGLIQTGLRLTMLDETAYNVLELESEDGDNPPELVVNFDV